MAIIKKLINPLALHDRIFWWSFFVAAPVLNALSFGLILWKIMPLRGAREAFALHYNIYFGIDLIGPWYKMLVMPGAAFLFWFLNLIFASISYGANRAFAYFAAGFTLFFQILIFAATVLVVLLNL